MGGWRFYLLIVHFKLGVKLLLCRVWPHVRSELRIRSSFPPPTDDLNEDTSERTAESEGPSFMTDLCGVCNRSPRSELNPADEPAAASTLQSFTAWSFRFRRIPSECLDKNEGVGGWCGDRGAAGSGCSVHLRTRRLPASLEGGGVTCCRLRSESCSCRCAGRRGAESCPRCVRGSPLCRSHTPSWLGCSFPPPEKRPDVHAFLTAWKTQQEYFG